MPLRTKFNDSIIQLDGDTSAHRHYHSLAFKNLLTILEVRDNILRNIFDSRLTSDECFKLRPSCLRLLHIVKLFSL